VNVQYRDFGTLNWKASALGFGCMRLPTLDGQRNSSDIDETESIRMIRHAIDNGVNYLDTAYPYHEGQSEVLVGKALQAGYRERVKVATKLPVWLVKRPEDFDRYLDEQLEKLQTGYVDFYLLHALNQSVWQDIVLRHNLLARAEAALADGRIRHLGFSFHGDYAAFYEIVNGSDLWTMCQIQYSYMDTDNQAGTRGLHLAAHKNLAVVVMEPLLGGRLADPPPDIRKLMEDFPTKRTAAEWALRWLWDQPEVSMVLSGMSNMSQVEQNLAYAESSRIGSFLPAETELIGAIRAKYMARTIVPCTRCGYCLPCPNGIDIPGNLELFNYSHVHTDVMTAKFRYKVLMNDSQRASACTSCGSCEPLCPQKIEIPQWMAKVSVLLD
jgi:predicted aldo/keto reductase-like oxidoreductase